MRLALVMIAGALLAAPAWAQEGGGGEGVDPGYVQPTQSPGFELSEALKHNNAMAQQAWRAGDYATARRYAVMLTRGAPSDPGAWLMLGATQRALEDWTGARRSYATAVRLSGTSAEARAGLGVALGRSGDKAAGKQLDWLATRAQACAKDCAQLIRYRADVEAAIAAGAKAG